MSRDGPKKKHEYYGKKGSSSKSFPFEIGQEPDSPYKSSPLPDVLPGSSSYSQSIPSQGCVSPFDYSSNPSLAIPHHFPSSLYGAGAYSDVQPTDLSDPYRKQLSSATGPSSYMPSEMHREYRRMMEESESVNGEMVPTFTIEDDEGETSRQTGERQKQKRTQRCRMCANHNKIIDMKGHKWYCEYRNCNCSDCDVTRKCQKYMKERQKLTRHQQQQQTVGESHFDSQMEMPEHSRRLSVDQTQIDFPREKEMVNETENILDYDFLEKVNQICRPKSSNTKN
ncbi:UNVERIFIED_CONTAM: hypothetical protein RMT77_001417 [Armadillidium vulgare]